MFSLTLVRILRRPTPGDDYNSYDNTFATSRSKGSSRDPQKSLGCWSFILEPYERRLWEHDFGKVCTILHAQNLRERTSLRGPAENTADMLALLRECTEKDTTSALHFAARRWSFGIVEVLLRRARFGDEVLEACVRECIYANLSVWDNNY
jgi:hypothetical protein